MHSQPWQWMELRAQLHKSPDYPLDRLGVPKWPVFGQHGMERNLTLVELKTILSAASHFTD
jgi:hypothetical protein